MNIEKHRVEKFFKDLKKGEGLKHAEVKFNGEKITFPFIDKKINKNWIFVIVFIGLAIAVSSIIINRIESRRLQNYKTLYINTKKRNLHLMVIENKYNELKYLTQNHKYKDIFDDYGWSPLHLSVLLNNVKITNLLLKNGAKKDVKSTKKWFIYPPGTTPRDIAVINNNSEILKIL